MISTVSKKLEAIKTISRLILQESLPFMTRISTRDPTLLKHKKLEATLKSSSDGLKKSDSLKSSSDSKKDKDGSAFLAASATSSSSTSSTSCSTSNVDKSNIFAKMETLALEYTSDAQNVINEIDNFIQVQGSEITINENCTFLMSVWSGDIYGEPGLEGLRELEKDLAKQYKTPISQYVYAKL